MLACGLTTIDLVQVVDAVPGANEKVTARSAATDVGGPAANAARTAAALGATTRLVTALGPGALAEAARAILTADGVRIDGDLAADGEPPLSTVLVTAATGERAVISANARGRAVGALDPADVEALIAWLAGDGDGDGDSAGGPGGALLVDGHLIPAQVALARAARTAGIPVLLDGGSWKPGLEALLAHVDVALVSADLAVPSALRSPEAPGAHYSLPVLPALAGLVPRGAWVARSAGGGDLEVRVPDGTLRAVPVASVPAEEIADTLGAGDVLHGATAAALSAGHDPLAAIAAGADVATESVRHAGALGWAYARARS